MYRCIKFWWSFCDQSAHNEIKAIKRCSLNSCTHISSKSECVTCKTYSHWSQNNFFFSDTFAINPLPHRDTFCCFCKHSRPRSGSSLRAAWSGSTLFANGNRIYLILHQWTWQVLSLFYVQIWKFIYITIHNGWSLAWIFMKERVKGLQQI